MLSDGHGIFTQITKTNAKALFNLGKNDLDGLYFFRKPVIGKKYCAHLYYIDEVWKRAIQFKRISRETPVPQIGPHYKYLTMAQVLPLLPGCAELDERFDPWIWQAIARYYERTLDLREFGYGGSSVFIARQLRVGVEQELNKMYRRWP